MKQVFGFMAVAAILFITGCTASKEMRNQGDRSFIPYLPSSSSF